MAVVLLHIILLLSFSLCLCLHHNVGAVHSNASHTLPFRRSKPSDIRPPMYLLTTVETARQYEAVHTAISYHVFKAFDVMPSEQPLCNAAVKPNRPKLLQKVFEMRMGQLAAQYA